MHFGKVQSDGRLEQVKGVTYSLDQFLGPELFESASLKDDDKSSVDSRSGCSQRHLYHVVIYLGPGDYHHFHSPVEWNVATRRHFPGNFLEV